MQAKTIFLLLLVLTASKAPKNIDWGSLPFGYYKTDYRFVAHWKDGKWSQGEMTTDDTVRITESAGVLQYAQTVFEGLKAFRTKDNKVVTFRPDLNAQRMKDSCERLKMPVYPEDKFVKACIDVVKKNIDWVPPYGTGAALYLRPFMFGSDAVLGVKPSNEYEFRVFASPVGPYFKGGVKPIKVRISDRDRAAPHGTGDIKAGLNYAMSLYNIEDAHKAGYNENIYTDPATHTYIEETGGANILFVTKDGKLITPKSGSILPSITRRSILYVAEHMLKMKVEERKIHKDEIKDMAEMGLCGTAAIISPVGQVDDHGKTIKIPSGMEGPGPVLKKIRETLVGIQSGTVPAPKGWIVEIK